jgi:molybdopterin molybdotransferase
MAEQIPIEKAFELILARVAPGPSERAPLAEALGRHLSEDARADRDWPPFERSMVDGYAVCSSDTRNAHDILEVIEEVQAGRQAAKTVTPGQAIRIMTGAPVPAGADAVIMRERTETPRPGFVKFMMSVMPGQNISRRGEDARAGAVVVPAGTRVTGAEIGVLASVGCHQVPVRRKPLIAILGTGDELVEPHETPGPAQIRNSNSHQLLAQCASLGLPARYLGVARDDRAATRALIEKGLQADVLISTGGVSVGEYDHVGAVLKELGVEILFDKVAIKPGKPTTFGKRGSTLVFGLPGNPVAAFVCFHLFVRTALRQRLGAHKSLPRFLTLPLAAGSKAAGDRLTFRPARLASRDGQACAEVLEWHGSGHLAALVGADGLVAQQPHEELGAGQKVAFYPFEGA